MDIPSLKKIVDRVKAGRFARLEARLGETRFGFTLERAAPRAAAPSAPGASPSPASSSAAGDDDGLVVVRSTLVGRFYSTATAQNVPPVKPGGRVRKGQRIGMIERMNLEHEIAAECDGTLVEILLDDGEPAMYGQPLFRIRPAKPAAGGQA